MPNRYLTDPLRLRGQKDVVEYFIDLNRRVTTEETSLRAGHTAIEDGNFTVRNGDIIVSESDDSIVLRLMHGDIPEIRMWPLGDTDTHRVAFFAYDDVDGGQTAAIIIETDPGTVIDGGKLLIGRNFAVLSHQPDASGGEESYFWLGVDPFAPEVASFRGKWANQTQYDDHQGIYAGTHGISAGFTSWTHTYSTPFASDIGTIVTLQSSAVVSWMVTAQSSSAFTVSWSGTTAKTLNFWNFRV